MAQKVADPCRNCGAVLTPGAAFCTLCGTAVANRAAASAPSFVPVGGPFSQTPQHGVPGIIAVGAAPAGPVLAPQDVGVDPRIAAAAALVPGGAGRRLSAKLIDGILPGLLVAIAGIVGTLMIKTTQVGSYIQYDFSALLILTGIASLLSIGYGIWLWFWEAKSGKTPGNLMLGLRTTNMEGGPAGVWAILVRNLIIGISSIVPTIGPLLVIISNTWDANDKLQGWHDKAAHTLVFNVKTGRDPMETGGIAGRADFVPAPVSTISPVISPMASPVQQSAFNQPTSTQPAPTQPAQQGNPFAPPSNVAPAMPPGGQGPITSVPGTNRPAPTASPFADSFAPPAVATTQPEIPWPAPNAVTNAAPSPAQSDAEAGETRVRPIGQSQRVRLTFDDGRTEDVADVALIGRNPAGYDGEMISHLISIHDTSRSVSKTHLHVRVSSEGLWVTDRNSTNGSAVTNPGAPRTILKGGTPTLAATGARVELGDRSFTVAHA